MKSEQLSKDDLMYKLKLAVAQYNNSKHTSTSRAMFSYDEIKLLIKLLGSEPTTLDASKFSGVIVTKCDDCKKDFEFKYKAGK